MARDSGKSYTGILQGSFGVGTAELTIDGVFYSGPAVRSSAGEVSAVTAEHNSAVRTVEDVAGNVGVRALLKSKDGRGLRCDLQGRSHGGTGLCVDDKNKAYDVVMILRD
ncbi:MAG: hypothetical protein WCL34_08185 [Methylococcaceae bacterium]